LRDIPLVGGLFGSKSESRKRTNLMVFLRPTIVNTPEQAREVTLRQYQAVQGFDGLDPAMRAKVERDFIAPGTALSIPASAPVVAAPEAPK
jgi:general secretion pathway protein D